MKNVEKEIKDSIDKIDLTNKESMVDFFLWVQRGFISARKAASIIKKNYESEMRNLQNG